MFKTQNTSFWVLGFGFWVYLGFRILSLGFIIDSYLFRIADLMPLI